jgi:hypothetical protein
VLFAACGGGGGSSSSSPDPAPAAPSADVNLLFMGNSHTANNDVPGMVAAMVRAARPGRSVAAANAPGILFLEERATDAATLQLLHQGHWSFVVLQAQESSSSWTVQYPTDGAEALVKMASEANAVPILFPEWPRRGIDESHLLFDLYKSIAQKSPACVAPVPQAFDLALARYPDLVLHAADGNHSAAAGAFLAALVIARTMTGYSPAQLPYLPQFTVDAATQEKLRLVAMDVEMAYQPPQLVCARQ